jgi:RNA polymerase III RPC4
MSQPTQAGKFKPRKPVKKASSAAATAAAAAASIVQPGSSVAGAGAAGLSRGAAAVAGGRGTRGRGRGGAAGGGARGGRGGRGGEARGSGGGRGGGRGRGRIQVQQGQAYFTAAPPAAATASRFGSSSSSSNTSKMAAAVAKRVGPGGSLLLVKKENGDLSQQEEEVVGMLDEAIGSAIAPDKVKSRLLSGDSGTGGEMPMELGGGGTCTLSAAAEKEASRRTEGTDAFTYDSDSSMQEIDGNDDDDDEKPLDALQQALEPMTLPFSPIPAPIGIGGTPETRLQHSNFYPSTNESNATSGTADGGDYATTATNKPASATTIITEDPILPSPFVANNDIHSENNSWFLVQLPTRLPPLQSSALSISNNDNNQDAPNYIGSGGDDWGAAASATEQPATMQPLVTIADVATAPVIVDSFDNALVSARAGRLGRFVVYKSGKTVLILETPDGGEIRMNATEGLTCAFRQQAVIINQDRSEFVPLGEVKKTIVVTPDLEAAFPS